MTDFINPTTPYNTYLYARGVLKRRWKEAEPVIMTDPYSAYRYARDVLKRRWEEAELVIKASEYWSDYAGHFNIKAKEIADLNTITIPYDGYLYITCRVDNTQLEAEPVIMLDLNPISPLEAYLCARNVLRRRWKEAEPVIMTDPFCAYCYARYVLKRRWKEAEPVIMTNPYYAFLYACEALKGRWEEAEPVIKASPYWSNYAEHFNIGR